MGGMRDILVHLDGGPRRTARLDVALGLARRFEARLTALFAQSEIEAASLVARRPGGHWSRLAEEAAVDFQAGCAAAGVSGRWWQLAHGEYSHVIAQTVICARYADLVVMGQREKRQPRVPANFIEKVVRDGGRPVLVVPEAGNFPCVGGCVVVAWNGGREASRALHDALPLLAKADEVTILSARAPLDGDDGRFPAVNIVNHLAVHGIAARVEIVPVPDFGVMDILLARSAGLGADLMVMGGLGHDGLSTRLGGSGTRYVLKHMTLPVLLSH